MIFYEDFKLCPVITQFSPAYITSSCIGPNILSILLSDILNLRFSPRGDSRSFALIRTILNIILIYICICISSVFLRRFSTSVGYVMLLFLNRQ